MSIAQLWRDQGKQNEARELLAPVYAWFSEGFNTRDLMEAKALLGELGHNRAHGCEGNAMERLLPLPRSHSK
jgi:predicted ATPase